MMKNCEHGLSCNLLFYFSSFCDVSLFFATCIHLILSKFAYFNRFCVITISSLYDMPAFGTHYPVPSTLYPVPRSPIT